jgi:hypothetical protein
VPLFPSSLLSTGQRCNDVASPALLDTALKPACQQHVDCATSPFYQWRATISALVKSKAHVVFGSLAYDLQLDMWLIRSGTREAGPGGVRGVA